jgi:NADPH:quinone reductase-like Zn-dependent oxidoreductase
MSSNTVMRGAIHAPQHTSNDKPMEATMKAIVTACYGAPEVLQLQEVATPTPKADEVLIKVHAAIVSASDVAFRKGDPFIIKLMCGLRKPRFAIQGAEFAGEIAAAGAAVTQFNVGDRVFGLSGDNFGAYGEYLCLSEKKPMIALPAGATSAEAVSLLDGAPTALIFLRDAAKVQPGQRVLVNGASGAVGAAAVQIAKHFGAHVTAVCSGANAEMVQALGADDVIDYTRQDFTRGGKTYDVIFDAVGKRTFGACRRALTTRGIYLTTVPTFGILFDMLRTLVGGKRAKLVLAGLITTKDTLNSVVQLFSEGALKPVIDRCYPLAQSVEAHRYVDSGRKRGSMVITMVNDEQP